MKATLSFNLPEEKEEFETAVKAPKLAYALEEIKSYFRAIVKYKDEKDHPSIETAYENVCQIISDIGEE